MSVEYRRCASCGKGVWRLTRSVLVGDGWVHPARLRAGCAEALRAGRVLPDDRHPGASE